MRISAAIAFYLVVTGCATDPEVEPFEFEQSLPGADDGKSDEPRACGTESCAPRLCGYDCTEQGNQCTESCAAADGRAATFVAAQVSGGASIDSRRNPYVPRLALDNVLIYGCELWDFSNGSYDGLEIEYEELIHSSFTVNPNDPTRTGHDLNIYIAPFTGPGSYRGQAAYRASHTAQRYAEKDGCAVDVAADATGGISGTFNCTLPAKDGGTGSISISGSFGCAENAMRPIFSDWAGAPR